MISRIFCVLAAFSFGLLISEANADFLVYKLGTKGQRKQPRGRGAFGGPAGPTAAPQGPGMGGPGMYGNGSAAGAGAEVVLYGTIKKEGAGIMYSHPEVGEPLIFQTNQVEIKTAPTLKAEFHKKMNQAGKEPDAVMHAAIWGLKKGLTGEFLQGVEKVLTLDPQHAAALRIRDLKREIDAPLPDQNDALLAKKLKLAVGQSGMQIETSNHFILLHDTDSKSDHGRHLSRAKERLRLLEQAYKKFVLLFEAQQFELERPQERFMVVLFKRHADFQDCSQQLGVTLNGREGFWSPVHNITFFYDGSQSEESEYLKAEHDKLSQTAEDAKKKGSSLERQRDSETLRQIKINNVLLEIDCWRSDMANVSRETTYQLAASLGVLPRRVGVPHWTRQGLAMYFEAPSDEAWAGTGAVDDARLEDYRFQQKDRLRSRIDFIVVDAKNDVIYAGSAQSASTAPAWSLTHYLFEKRPQELVAYYKLLGDMPRDVVLNPDVLGPLFSRAFGADHQSIQQEWQGYMRTLKSDIEQLEEAGGHSD